MFRYRRYRHEQSIVKVHILNSWKHEYLYKIAWSSIRELFRYLGLEQNVGLTSALMLIDMPLKI